MTTTVSTIESLDFLQPNGFKLVVNRKRFKNLEFFAQSVTHPDVSVQPTTIQFRGNNLLTPGDKIEYGSFMVNAIIDENMNVYKEMLEWMKSSTGKVNATAVGASVANEDLSIYDMTLSILSSHNNQIDRIVYRGAFPVNVGSINFQSTVDNLQYITVPITFAYTTFTITS
jgi:hypothetical protein